MSTRRKSPLAIFSIILIPLTIFWLCDSLCNNSSSSETLNYGDLQQGVLQVEPSFLLGIRLPYFDLDGINNPIINDEGHKVVVKLTEKNFSSFIGENDYVMVYFGYPSDPRSRKLASRYEAAAATLSKDGEVAFAKVDFLTDKDLYLKYKLSGNPRVILFSGGNRKVYDGCGTRDDIVRWVRKNAAGVPIITQKDDAEQLLASDSMKVVGFYDSLESEDSKELYIASKLRPDLKFYQITDPEIAKMFRINPEIKHPVLIQLRKEDEDFRQFVGPFTGFEIANFLSCEKPHYNEERSPVVLQLPRIDSFDCQGSDRIYSGGNSFREDYIRLPIRPHASESNPTSFPQVA